MSLHEVAAPRTLLARKGEAVPAGRDRRQAGNVEPSLVMVGAPKNAATHTGRQAEDLFPEDAAAARESEAAPAASLLSFDPLVRRRERGEPPHLTDREPETRPATAPEAAAPVAAQPAPPRRSGVEPRARPRRSGRWFVPVGLAAALAAIIAIGWLSFQSAPGPAGQAAETAATSQTKGVAPVATPSATAASSEAAPAGDSAPAAAGEPAEPAIAPAAGDSPAHRQTATVAPEAREAEAPAPARPDRAAPATPGPADAEPAGAAAKGIAPSVDVVRLDPDGRAVIAGRAAPNTELIVLDNGRPFATVKADAYGEWVLVPDTPLPAGAHEFGLVVKSVETSVTLPAPKATAPAADPPKPPASEPNVEEKLAPVPHRKPISLDAPIPPRKPGSALLRPSEMEDVALPSPNGDFVVQLASVKTRAGAEREWLKLKRRYPDLLARIEPSLTEARLDDQGTVVRVRAGPLPHHEAEDVCARLQAVRQECLVVKTARVD